MEDQKNPEWHPRVVKLMYWEKIVESIPREKLPEVWCNLNRFQWHSLLGDKPYGWDEMTDEEKHYAMKFPFGVIKSKCSKKELLRYANTVEDHRMTNAQFDDWWDSRVREDIEKILEILEENKSHVQSKRGFPVDRDELLRRLKVGRDFVDDPFFRFIPRIYKKHFEFDAQTFSQALDYIGYLEALLGKESSK